MMDGNVAVEASDTFTNTTGEDKVRENCVEYSLFLLDHRLDVRQTRQHLDTLRKTAVQLSQSLSKDYIWQHDGFQLELKTENGFSYLYGMTEYGDAVEDEWLIVYLLRELTTSNPSLWVRVADSDGEFLLIEAANVLPKWLSPEMDQCRVWMHDGKLQIIYAKDSTPSHLSLPQAFEILKTNPDALVYSEAIQKEAFYRLEKYPQHIAKSMHHSLVTIPRKLAYILHLLPKAIGPAIECFYLRDPIALKPILSDSAPLVFPPRDLVTVSARFSKVLFAQLRSQRFEPPPRWQSILRNGSGTKSSTNDHSRERDMLELGMKLTSGFEMLAAHAEKHKSKIVREMVILLEDLLEDGEDTLPFDSEIATWDDHNRNDDESWLDINFDDFEHELGGTRADGQDRTSSGFGDAQTQENLQKIVSRFKGFVDDDDAGLDGAELGSEESGADEEDEDSGLEDEEVTFDGDAFAGLLKEMMGRTPRYPNRGHAASSAKETESKQPDYRASSTGGSDEDIEIQELSSRMEAELKQFGALRIDDQPSRRAIKGNPEEERQRKRERQAENSEDEEGSEEEIDVDYNLAKNLLESFKSQGGMAGPAGNLMGLMGFQLPRDEDDGKDDGNE